MTQLPDAPWIRDAEINGMPDGPDPICPICESECDTFYYDNNGDLVGCENCISTKDAYEHMEDSK